MAVYEPRAIEGRRNELIPLTRGLDLTTTPTQRAPGSLLEAINVEFVDGVLQMREGQWRAGDIKFNSIPKSFAVLYGDDTDDYTLTGSITNFEKVLWYTDGNSDLDDPNGSGYWWTKNISSAPTNYQDPIAIAFPEGKSPADSLYFVGEDSGAIVEVTDFGVPLQGFQYINEYTDVQEDSYSRLLIGVIQGYTSNIDTWDARRAQPMHGGNGISHVFQHNDDIFAVADFPVLRFVDGTEEPSITDKIQVIDGVYSPTAYVARVELVTGSWDGGDAEGWLYLYPQSDSTLNSGEFLSGIQASNVAINNLTTANQTATTRTQVYPNVVRYKMEHGLMWRLDTAGRINTGWKYHDMGYSVQYNNGAIAPLSTESPVFVTDSLEVLQDSGNTFFGSPATEFPATGTFSAWTGLANLAADDGTNATSTIATSDWTRNLEMTPAVDTIPGNAKIIGIEVILEAHQTTGTDIVINNVQLRKGTTASGDPAGTEYYSANRADREPLTGSAATYTYGGQLDLWGFEEITQADFNAQDIEVVIQFENTNGASTRIVNLDYVQFKVHYLQNGQDIYFYDGSSDVATGTLYSYQVHDGEWSTDDAKGYMTFTDITDPSACIAGTGIFTQAAGAGDQIATVVETTKNILPGVADMEAAGTRSQFLQSNIGGGEEDSKIFVTNGVSPCFSLDENGVFQFIRTPVDPTKDNPRYVEEISEHLVLALKEHALVSSIATPNNFSTYDGATVWATGDEITGLVAAPGNTIIVLSQNSVHILGGKSASGDDPFNLQRHSTTTGARHYSGVYINGSVTYLDDVGLTTLATSDKYGDFDAGKLSYPVEEWLRNRVQDRTGEDLPGITGFLEAIPCRKKNQIRLFFNDGWVLVGAFPPPGSEDPRPQFTTCNGSWYTSDTDHATQGAIPIHNGNFTPKSLSSQVNSKGKEIILHGNGTGAIYIQDQAQAWSGTAGVSEASFVTNHIHANNPLEEGEKYLGAVLAYERDGEVVLSMTSGIDWNLPPTVEGGNTNNGSIIAGGGDYDQTTNIYPNRYIVSQADYFNGQTGTSMSWRVQVGKAYSYYRPVKFIAIAPRRSTKSSRKANIQRSVLDSSS